MTIIKHKKIFSPYINYSEGLNISNLAFFVRLPCLVVGASVVVLEVPELVLVLPRQVADDVLGTAVALVQGDESQRSFFVLNLNEKLEYKRL